MLTAGPRASLGLLSPGDRRIERGRPFTIAFGIWGALNCRAGFVVEDAASCRRGSATTSSGWSAPTSRRSPSGTGAPRRPDRRRAAGDRRPPARRPVLRDLPQPRPPAPPRRVGQLAGLRRLTVELRSGMALQGDIIPATGTAYFTTNIEDGIALAGRGAARALAAAYPEAWRRIQARRRSCATRSASTCTRRAAVLQHPGPPAAVPAAARPGDDPGS